MAQAGCSSVIAGTAYATATVTTLIPTITGTQTRIVRGPAETSFSTYVGTIRGIPTTEVFTVEIPGAQTTLIPVSGYLTSLVLESTPVSYIYSTVCPTTTSSTLSSTTTTTTTTTSTTTSAPPSTISSRTTTTTTTPPPTSSSSTTSSSTTTQARSTSTSFVIVPASSSSSSGNTSATALSNAANGKNNASSSNTGAIAGGVVGGIAALAILAGLGFWFFRRRSNKHEHEFDPFSNDDPWNPAVEGMGGAAGAGGYGAARYSKADELAYADGDHHLNSSSAGLAGAGAAAAFGYGGAHGRSRSDHSHEKGDAAYYAPVSSAGSPPRRTSRRKAPPSAEQHEMYYTGGGGAGMSSDGHGDEYGYASAYDSDPYGQQYYPPPQQQQQPQVPFGQPGGLMQYPGQGAPTYPPQHQQQQQQAGAGGAGGIAYHHSTPSDGHHSYGATGNEQEYLADGGSSGAPAPPSALVPGNIASPAPSHRSIPHLGAMQFEHDPMPLPGQQGHHALRVMNDAEDPYGGMDDAAAAQQQQQHYYQQQQQYGGAYHH